jgi:hypothetical protein
MFKITTAFVLIVICFNAFCAELEIHREREYQDLKTLISSNCNEINPVLLNYLESSQYLEKRIEHTKLALKYNQESDEMFRNLNGEAEVTSNASKMLMAASILLLTRGLIAASSLTVVGRTIISLREFSKLIYMSFSSQVTPFIVLPTVLGGLGIIAAVSYKLFINPFVQLYKTQMAEVRTLQEAKILLKKIQGDFKKAHAYLDNKRNEVDLDYTPLENGLSLGSKALNSTEALYEISVAKTMLYASELDFLLNANLKVIKCTAR